jgi:Ca2+-binding RTX toxin-like protein
MRRILLALGALALPAFAVVLPAGAPAVGAEPCTITGTPGDDVLIGTSGPDVICGLEGNDTLRGRGGGDVLYGNDGDDVLLGRGGADRLLGAAGHDSLTPGPGDDDVDGGGARDHVGYRDVSGGVVIDLGAGTAAGTAAGPDTLTSIEGMTGTMDDDTLTGTIDKQYIAGIGGDDHIAPGGGSNDWIRGGGGEDVLSYAEFTAGFVHVDLRTGVVHAYGKGNIDRFEVVISGPRGGQLIGDSGDNVLIGGAGPDDLLPMGGDDIVEGGPGPDVFWADRGSSTLDGGPGRDRIHAHFLFPGGIWVDLDAGIYDKGAGWGVDQVTHLEEIWGTGKADHLYGGLGETDVTFWAFGGGDDVSTKDGIGGDRLHAARPDGPTSTCTFDEGDFVDC